MIKTMLKISEITCLNKDIYKMTFKGDFRSVKGSGQFIELEVKDFYLRRPISIYDYNDEYLTIIFKVVGNGTKKLSEMKVNEEVSVIYPCGTPFDVNKMPEAITLVGGGIGVPPLYHLAKELLNNNKKVKVVLGFTTKDDVILVDEFKKLGIETLVTTVDGSVGEQGFVTKVMGDNVYTCSCGPLPMLKAVYDKSSDGQFSFEARMGCGFGGCMGCSMKTKNGYKRVCKEGPIFYKEEIVW